MDDLTFDQKHSPDVGLRIRDASGRVSLEITDDWYGDSITGFGAQLDYDLTEHQALYLFTWLGTWLFEEGARKQPRSHSSSEINITTG